MTESHSGEPLRAALAARVGRKDATVVEIDRGGVRVRHSGAIPLGSELRISFKAGGEIFAAPCQILSCRVIGLGLGDGGATLFESKLSFTDAGSADAVERVLGAVSSTSALRA